MDRVEKTTDTKYGFREDEVELHRHHDKHEDDEEAQLLDGADYDQFELDEVARYQDVGGGSVDQRLTDVEGRGGPERKRGVTTSSRFISFLRGPATPEDLTISPVLRSVQELPVRWLKKALSRRWQRLMLLALGLLAWIATFTVLLRRGKGTLTDAKTGRPVVHMDCVDTLWRRNNECGLDGVDCQPFANDTIAFQCPASCAGVRVLNPHHVGPVDVNYRPLVIGGPVYRADSFVCGSAIHAGVIDDATGGCGTITLKGDYYSFYPSLQHGIESVGFDSYFPLAFTVDAAQCGGDDGGYMTGKDPRQLLLFVSLVATVTLSLFTTSAAILFFVSFIGIFVHVALVSDPPNVSGPSDTVLPDLISLCAERLLPSLFCAVIIYLFCARRTLQNLVPSAQIEKTALWLGGFWVGALSNYTLEKWIPLSRLSAHDLAHQPGARAALAGIVIVLLLCASLQAYHFWREGRFLRYLGLYLVVLIGIIVLATSGQPNLELRIHHYILGLLFLPLTSMQTRPSLVYQGLLLGLFVNGVARWGFDSILQTPWGLRGDALFEDDGIVPDAVSPLIYLGDQLGSGRNFSLSLKWAVPATLTEETTILKMTAVDGISVLVNDVERYRGFFGGNDVQSAIDGLSFTWTRSPALTTPEYFRFAYVLKRSGRTLDYSEAGTWFANGTWSQGPGYYR
ncbi:hypothetical protein B0H66DRAFT_474290 [Apodospora peruviana]|uniref:LCCL domain-containing protein n=1 Tax=Apodospora peruviana TaxID=516989 RepID=A0AAE0IAQ0_9PEZI|nr:hypothetical protein B0H66DRAFT_474290 [Apodospora peruviana]